MKRFSHFTFISAIILYEKLSFSTVQCEHCFMFNLCMNCGEKVANQKMINVAFFNTNHSYTEKP